MKEKFILISGSAGISRQPEKLALAIEFVQCFTSEVLRRGGGMVVLAGAEESTKDQLGIPHIFDWVVLREVNQYARTTTDSPRCYAKVVMSNAATESKIDDTNLLTLKELQQRNVIEIHHIRREVFTGGEYRKAELNLADAMLAIGGGKGTYSIGTEMTAAGKPVLPLDLDLGAYQDDGDGAVTLNREMMSHPNRFFPNTHPNVINRLQTISLNRGISDAKTAAQAAAEMMSMELDASIKISLKSKIKHLFSGAWQAVKTLPLISAAIKITESIIKFIPWL